MEILWGKGDLLMETFFMKPHLSGNRYPERKPILGFEPMTLDSQSARGSTVPRHNKKVNDDIEILRLRKLRLFVSYLISLLILL